MLSLLPWALSILAAALSRPEDEPTNLDLEAALRGTSGMTYGADEDEPALAAESQPAPFVEKAFKPHELLLRMDIRTVPDDLLLGILLAGAAFGDPVDAARRLMVEASFDVARLREPSMWERTRGVGPVGHARVLAAMELARRIDVRSSFSQRTPITSPDAAVAAFRTMSFGPDEILSALFLDRRRRLLGGRTITMGSDGFTVVDPRQIFRIAFEMGASAVILAHNHPTGDATPSSQDRDVTERVARAGRVLGLPLLDHIVLGSDGSYTSFAERGELPPWVAPGPTWTAEGASEQEEPPYEARVRAQAQGIRWCGVLSVQMSQSSSDPDHFRVTVEGPGGRFRSVVSRFPGRGPEPVTEEDLDRLAVTALRRAEEEGFDTTGAVFDVLGSGYQVTMAP